MSLKKLPTLSLSLASSIALLLSACGSSDSNNDLPNNNATTEISGTVFASYVSGASVTANDRNGNVIAGPVLSDYMGLFTLDIPNRHLDDDLVFKAINGLYRDEATGESANNSELSGFIAANTLNNVSGAQFSLTPSSTIVQRLIGQHDFSYQDAQTRFEESFGYEPMPSTLPVDITSAPGDTEESRTLAGLRAAIFSQLTSDLGLPAEAQGQLLMRLADDISDGTLDGMDDDTALLIEQAESSNIELGHNIQNRFNRAFSRFRSSGNDMSGLDNASVGHLPFAKTASSDNYVVTYIPSMTGTKQGKTQFSLMIEDQQGNPVSDLSPTVAPLMMMSDRNHATPMSEVQQDSEQPGLYHATVYYLMPSSMANGDSMGYWQLTVDLGEEELVFYPNVMMSMGDTPRANLKSQSDFVAGMMGVEEKRTYILFNNGLTEGHESDSFSVFIATKENMMSFPAIEIGAVYNADSEYELVVSNVTVEMSSDPEDSESWIIAESLGKGVWTASGLSIMEDSVFVRVSVNDEQVTDDGNSPDGEDDSAEFLFSMDDMEHSHDMGHSHDAENSGDMNSVHNMM